MNFSLLKTKPTESCLYLFDLLWTFAGLSVFEAVLERLDVLEMLDMFGLNGGLPFKGSLVGD